MEQLSHLLTHINEVAWGIPAIVLLIGIGLYLTIRLKLIQLRGIKHAFALTFSGKYNKSQHGEISHFRALMTGLSGTIGTGNIAGVATAITLGGPGAIFWMWVSAIFGMATKFASCTLAVKFRNIHENGEVSGGPMYTLEKGLKLKSLAKLFAALTIIASFGIGNTVQASSVVSGLNYIIPDSTNYNGFIGIILCIAVGCVILGGIKRIARSTSIIVPVMTVFYLAAGTLVLLLHFSAIPHAFYLIFNYAFNPHAIGGGMLGAAIQFGMARGIFSNEAGLGSSAMVHAAAKTDEPVREGLVAMLEPFFDTLVICTFTALVILVSQAWQPNVSSTMQSTALSAHAFNLGLDKINDSVGDIGSWIVGVSVVFFAYSSIITWSYYGDRAAEYLFGHKSIFIYRLIFTIVVFFGAVAPLQLVWQLADLANILMAIPNLISVFLLAPLLKQLMADYFQRH